MTEDSVKHGEVDERLERAAIDSSCKIAVLFFYGSAILWLLAGTLFGLLASIKLHHPGIPPDLSWLTFGRIRPSHMNIMVFGWATSAAFGTGIWLMARLCHTKLRRPTILLVAGVLWNLGILIGIGGILAGEGTSIEWLEFPAYAHLILFIAYVFIGAWAILMFYNRKKGHVYVSQWYIFAAFFWFPWMYGVALLLLLIHPVQGTFQAIVNWWFVHNLVGLWFTTVGLGAIYYMIPKVIGKPIHSYYLSMLGFWSFALFYSWNGAHHLIGGPVPVWVQSASIAASMMMIIPVITVAINHHMTLKGSFGLLRSSPTLRFVVFGAMCYTLVSLQGISMAFRKVSGVLHFTHYTIAHSHLGLYAFFTMVMFGSMYYIIPRLVEWEWPSAILIRVHFWCAAIGIVLMVGILMIGGFFQGLDLNNPKIPFIEVVKHVRPYLEFRSLTGMLLGFGHLSFAASFVLILLHSGARRTEPTLFTSIHK